MYVTLSNPEEIAMPQSLTGFMMALAIYVCVALLAATRYRTEHPIQELMRWMHAHHLLDRIHRKR